MEKEYLATVEFEPIKFLVYAESYKEAKKSAMGTAADLRQIISKAVQECIDIVSVEVEGCD